MIEIDWSKAPEGATHYFSNAGSGKWRDLSGVYWRWWSEEDLEWKSGHGCRSDRLLDREDLGINARPGYSKWKGEGLPPVGTLCEYEASRLGNKPVWYSVSVKYVSDQTIVLACTDVPDGGERKNIGVELSIMVGVNTDGKFRPIRTPEQVSADERDSAVREMADIAHKATGFGQNLADHEALYDAGYRRQEKP